MGGSVAFHALVALWSLSNITQVELLPQQVIQISMVAASDMEESKPEPVTQENRPQDKEALFQKKHLTAPKPPPKPPTVDSKKLSGLTPAAGSNAVAETSQIIMTKPLFDTAYLHNPAPIYPAHAKRRGIEGTVMLDVAVDSSGVAKHIIIAKTSGFTMLDESAKDAVSHWKFVPAKRGSETVEARVIVPVEFRLE